MSEKDHLSQSIQSKEERSESKRNGSSELEVQDESATFTKEDYILLAKMSEQTERYDEMIGFVKKFIDMTEGLVNQDERYYFTTAFKNAVGNRRAELRLLTSIELKEQRNQNDTLLKSIQEYKRKIEVELEELCQQVLDIIDEKMLPYSKNPENEIFFKKMKADYLRYLAEFLEDDRCTDIVQDALKLYTDCDTLVKNHLPPTHPLRLGHKLNISVFYYEVLQEPGKAIMVANAALEEAFANIDKIHEEYYKDSTLIMQLLRDNLTLWSCEIPGGEAGASKQ